MTQVQPSTSGDSSASQAPRPTFDAIPLSPDVRKAVDTLGYVHPTPVQLAVFEPATRGKSLVVQARTGTGKTAAFGLPIVDTLVKRSQPGVQALVLTPTRELAIQVAREIEQLAQFRGTKIVPIYGGAPMGRQIAALEEGAQVVSGTPGRVLDHIRRGTLDTSGIRIFVLDEADEMLSMGFAKELNAIIETLPKERQGLYFSATIPPDVERLAASHLREPEYITLSSDQVGALEIAHYVYLVREGDKRGALLRILEVEDPEGAIIFCNTKDETERLAELLKSRGFDADWLNGDLDQREREKVMSATKEGRLRFLVATDVAARGIDISHLTHVINADFPESAEQYVHRTGRTGRAGRTGTAISIVGPKDVGHLYMLRLTYKIRPIERSLPTKGELRTRAETDLVAFLADAYGEKTPDAGHLAIARRLLTHESAETIIAGLVGDHLGARATEAVAEDAAEARRAKNPPPVAETKPRAEEAEAPTKLYGHEDRPRGDTRGRGGRERGRADQERADTGRSEVPRTLRDGEPPRAGDGRGRRDRGRSHSREGIPQASLSQWEPPSDDDDDRPILKAGERGQRGEGGERGEARDRDARGTLVSPSNGTSDASATPRAADEAGAAGAGHPARGRARAPRARAERGGAERGEERSADRSPERGPDNADDIGADFANIFLNVGRRDGLKPDDLVKMLTDLAGIPEAETGRIRVRDRITFIAVKKEVADRAIRALAGQVVGGRTVSAEPARERD